MRAPGHCFSLAIRHKRLHSQGAITDLPIIHISKATFYRKHPSPSSDEDFNPALFPDLNFSLPSFTGKPKYWSIIGPSASGKTTFLEILRGQHLCLPPTARSFPYLASDDKRRHNPELRTPSRAIQYVGFNSKGDRLGALDIQGAYLSARYESRKEVTDYSLFDYLQGNTSLNPLEKDITKSDSEARLEILDCVIEDLKLKKLVDLPVGNLSNGQTRRARIAKAMMQRPEVLLLDEPFMGLDPPTLQTLSPLLYRLAKANSPRIVLTLRPQDPLPDWITDVIYLNADGRIAFQGTTKMFLEKKHEGTLIVDGQQIYVGVQNIFSPAHQVEKYGLKSKCDNQILRNDSEETLDSVERLFGDNVNRNAIPKTESTSQPRTHQVGSSVVEPLVQMEGVKVKYGDRQVLGNWKQNVDGEEKDGLWWTVNRGDRIGVFGPNGSGKTTILSLICSDHPQTYSLPIKLFGRSRLPTPGHPGISIFDIQARIGHSSPEVHTFFPRNLTVRQTLENAWADTFLGKAVLNYERDMVVDACLRWFRHELDPKAEGDDLVDTIVPIYQTGVFKHGNWNRLLSAYQETDVDWADSVRFRDLPFSSQRVALFLRAIIKKPDLVLLDEAFSGMDETTREKCMLFLANGESKGMVKGTRTTRGGRFQRVYKEGITSIALEEQAKITGLEERQALLCVSHVKEEIPGAITEWLCLPEPNSGKPVRFGHIEGQRKQKSWWDKIWGLSRSTKANSKTYRDYE